MKSQQKMKASYDNKAIVRRFVSGNKVLLFLPIPSNSLKSKFTGSCVVSHKLSGVNYVILTPDRRKDTQLVHVNLMKPYFEQEKVDSQNLSINCNAAAKFENPVAEEVVNIPTPKLNPINSVWLTDMSDHVSHLNSEQKADITNLLQSFPEVTSDIPGKCNVIQYDTELLPSQASPIIQPAYRDGPRKLEAMKAEVDYLLKNN